MIETIKVEIVYLWEKHKDTLRNVLFVITFPFWIVLAFIVCLFAPDTEEEIKWCKEHGYEYPDYAGWDAHDIVKKWKKEYNRQERITHKERIRWRLRYKED